MANPFTRVANKIVFSVQEMFNQSFDSDFNQNTVEIVGYDGQNLQRLNADGLLTEIDYNSGTNPIYVGIAAPGTATSAANWQIKKMTYDSNNNVTAVQYGGGTASFNQIWDNRASLTYS